MGAKSAPAPRPGEVFQGKYRVLRVVGNGGMGMVFAAHHLLLDVPVAIKLLSAEVSQNPENIARLVNEARLAARIRSEHVCHVMDVGTVRDGRPYLVMELLEGSDLAAALRARGPLPTNEVSDWILQALEGLAHAHVRGIVHRDLKPSNLFLTPRTSGPPVVKIVDFGISKAEEALVGGGGITSTRAILGSPAYMAPEQIKDARMVDARADVWSIGVIMYELLTGICPFDAPTSGLIFARVLGDGVQPPPIAATRREFPTGLDELVQRCLCKDREERFGSVLELARALAPFASMPEAAAAAVERIRETLARPAVPSWGETSGSLPQLGAPSHPTNVSWAAASHPQSSLARSVAVGVGAAFAFLVVTGSALVVWHKVRVAPPPSAASAMPAATDVAPSPAVPLPLPAPSALALPDPDPAAADPLPPPEITSAPLPTIAPPSCSAATPPSRPARPHPHPPTKQDLLKDRR